MGSEVEPAPPGSLAGTVAELKSAVEYSMGPLPVRRFELVDRTGSRTIYSLAGFDTGMHNLSDPQRTWLASIFGFIKACSKDNTPVIRLSGFASAQKFPKHRDVEDRSHLCKPEAGTTKNDSDYNNCYLANQRAAKVAAYLNYLHDSKDTWDESEFLQSAKTMLGVMNNHCEDRSRNTSFDVFRNVGTVKLAPWCSVGQMKSERFQIRGSSVVETEEDQSHFLNRSVHIEILNPGKCAGR